jgi:hypothetical protein
MTVATSELNYDTYSCAEPVESNLIPELRKALVP